MIFNGSEKIKDDGGDYLVLTDYGCEGFAVTHQAETHEDALRWMTEYNYGSPHTLVKLVRVDTRDVDLHTNGMRGAMKDKGSAYADEQARGLRQNGRSVDQPSLRTLHLSEASNDR